MQLLTPSGAQALLITIAETGLALLALYRRLWKRLPIFNLYLVILAGVEWARLWVWTHSGVNSATYSWTYWTTQPALVVARGAALADLCGAALRLYTGVWQVARALLGGAAIALLVAAGVRTAGTRGIASYAIFVERELEIAIVLSIVLLLVLSRYYGVALERPLGGVAFGLAFYSSVIVVNSSILLGPLALSWPVWSAVRIAAFEIAMIAWFLAIRLPLPDPARPQLTTATEFADASVAVDQRMRELNARLLQILKQ